VRVTLAPPARAGEPYHCAASPSVASGRAGDANAHGEATCATLHLSKRLRLQGIDDYHKVSNGSYPNYQKYKRRYSYGIPGRSTVSCPCICCSCVSQYCIPHCTGLRINCPIDENNGRGSRYVTGKYCILFHSAISMFLIGFVPFAVIQPKKSAQQTGRLTKRTAI
jgi:hypothetical protein